MSKQPPTILNIGCGITAFDVEDAKNILTNEVFSIYGKREIITIIEDIDISTLDQNHVIPNMGTSVSRGVWFPLM